MGVWSRILTLFRIKANKALDRAEDPRETLDYSYEKQVDLLQEMRRGIAEVATARKRIELQQRQLQQSAGRLTTQAQQALQTNREDLARQALTRRVAIESELGELQVQRDQLHEEEQKMIEASRVLENKLATMRTRKETMKASYSAAEAQVRVGEAATGISKEMGEVMRMMRRAEDRVAEMQARSGALEELTSSGALEDLSVSGDRIQAELDVAVAQAQVDAEMAKMKRQLPAAQPGLTAPTETEKSREQR
ncbi:MAG TPA: PspA/IM30 family protein [Actinomycetota bacterium]|nr:PspA/IM30 family protein [Actinomycetota bacterium]